MSRGEVHEGSFIDAFVGFPVDVGSAMFDLFSFHGLVLGLREASHCDGQRECKE